tara:strand:+ start:72 stop:560 length:489 start_codon:yes stop_codon:yes gene_type:complete
MPKTTEEKAAYMKEYRKKNKERIAAKQKEYNIKNREKLAEKRKIYIEEHKGGIKEYNKKTSAKRAEYYQEHKEEIAEKKKEYSKTPAGKKTGIISKWKYRGIKSDNYDTLYDNYLKSTNCEECGIPYGKKGDGTRSVRCCDHDHSTGLFRNFLCASCNIKRG